jgi:S-methylmethionine-dependent homocysteine/selenocysteine methylase
MPARYRWESNGEMIRLRHMAPTLPQLAGDRLFLTDGGLETTLVFHRGMDLPAFAAFPLLDTADGRAALRDYFLPYLETAREQVSGFVLDTATWRANPDWGPELGYDTAALDRVNRDAVAFALALREEAGDAPAPIVVNGVVGPRGDGYVVGALMAPAEALAYHAPQVASFAAAGVDMVSAITMTYAEEAIGIANAAAAAGIPVAISFTVETDGRLPSGQALRDAIEQVDAETLGYPAYYMVNCAHPSHFAGVVAEGGAWRGRIAGIRANASAMSHAELDAAEELDEGDPLELGGDYVALRPHLPAVTVLGGCCGTDARHVAAVGAAWAGQAVS